MALSDRVRNYEAKATSFAFKAFFYEFLQIYQALTQSTKEIKQNPDQRAHLSLE
jgi:hypothetical protein